MKKETNGKPNIITNTNYGMIFIACAIIFLLIISLSFYFALSAIKNTILDLDITNTEDISFHENKLVSNIIEDIWDDMDIVSNDLISTTSLTTEQDIIDFAAKEKLHVQNCIDLAFVSTDGYFYGLNESTPVLNKDIYYTLELKHNKYVMKSDNKKVLSDTFGENKIFVYEKFTPTIVAGVEFKYLISTLSISSIQNLLDINSYEAKGNSFIIDTNGEYIDDRSATEENDYFEHLSSYQIEGFSSTNEFIKELRNIDDHLTVIISNDNSKEIVVFTPIENTNWISVSTLPKEVYDEQTDIILRWFIILIVVIMLIIIIFILILYLFIKKSLSHKVEKEYTTQIEEKNKELETKQIELEDALDKASKASNAKTTFLFNMSHDIRTPMNAIIGYNSLAKLNINDTNKVESYLNKVDVSSTKLLNILNDILDMSKLETGKWNISETSANMIDAFEGDFDSLELSAKDKNLTFNTNINITHKNVIIDAPHLSRVITNVISNSIKYTLPGGIIKVSVTESPSEKEGYGKYTFVCEDNGIGIDKEYLPHIFETFSREANTTMSGVQGSGLGMAISKQLVDTLGGRIEIESEKNKGTIVTIIFDLKFVEENTDNEAIDNEANTDQDALNKLAGKRILIVEDNEINREILKEILEEEGFYCDEADDGDVAVEMFKESKQNKYDLILMDIQMPKMNGYDATRAIRKLDNEDALTIPILACSANAFEEDIKKSFESGMNAHISKPLDINILNKHLIKFL